MINSSVGWIQEVWGVYKHSFCTYSYLRTSRRYDYISHAGPARLMQRGL